VECSERAPARERIWNAAPHFPPPKAAGSQPRSQAANDLAAYSIGTMAIPSRRMGALMGYSSDAILRPRGCGLMALFAPRRGVEPLHPINWGKALSGTKAGRCPAASGPSAAWLPFFRHRSQAPAASRSHPPRPPPRLSVSCASLGYARHPHWACNTPASSGKMKILTSPAAIIARLLRWELGLGEMAPLNAGFDGRADAWRWLRWTRDEFCKWLN